MLNQILLQILLNDVVFVTPLATHKNIIMKSTLLTLLTLCLFQIGFSQKLLVEEGQTVVIHEMNTTVNELIMEDNSTIKLEGISDWYLNARISKIGKNCRIVGVGDNGAHGRRGKNGTNATRECGHGGRGNPGGHGQAGEDGVNIKFTTEFIQLETLEIDVRGGRGGNGGNGGRGGSGRKASLSRNCRGGNGGTGGTGGNAGIGGTGGNILIEYSKRGKTPYLDDDLKVNSIRVYTSSGTNGNVGIAGGGGPRGGESRSFLGNKGAGNPGSRGADGRVPSNRSIDGRVSKRYMDSPDCLEDEMYENYAIIIANSNGQTSSEDNPVFVEDAKRLAKLLKEKYAFDDVDTFYNKSRRQLESEILSSLSNKNYHQLFIFISGHGVIDNGHYSFVTSDNFPMPFDAIYSYVEKADIEKKFLILDACHSGKIFDNRQNSIEAYTPHSSRLLHKREGCGKQAMTVVSSGFDDETVPARDFITHVTQPF